MPAGGFSFAIVPMILHGLWHADRLKLFYAEDRTPSNGNSVSIGQQEKLQVMLHRLPLRTYRL